MGKHFDGLVEVVKKHITREDSGSKYIPRVKDYLTKLVNRATLFEFPLQAEEIRPQFGKEEGYQDYLADYFDLSKDNDCFFITPFNITAIEDPVSVVIADNIRDNEYLVTHSMSQERLVNGKPTEIHTIGCSHIIAGIRKGKHKMFENHIKIDFYAVVGGNKRLPISLENLSLHQYKELIPDFNTGLISYFEECIYIMDPQNFIIKKESNQSKKMRAKNKKPRKQNQNLRKTTMRPHYICLSNENTTELFRGKTDSPIRPVRGHWRKLTSSWYKKMKGKIIHVPQYYKGKGEIETEGWNYAVMLKTEPGKLVPYKEVKAKQS